MLFACHGCYQLHLNPPPKKKDGYQKDQWKVGKTLIFVILTKNALFRTYSTFACLLRVHICNINRCIYITSARGHKLSGSVHAYANIYIYAWADCVTLRCFEPPLSETIEWCSLKSVTTTLGLFFSWLHMLHCTVVITLGNPVSSPSSCLVHMIL